MILAGPVPAPDLVLVSDLDRAASFHRQARAAVSKSRPKPWVAFRRDFQSFHQGRLHIFAWTPSEIVPPNLYISTLMPCKMMNSAHSDSIGRHFDD